MRKTVNNVVLTALMPLFLRLTTLVNAKGSLSPALVYPPSAYANAKYPLPAPLTLTAGGLNPLDESCANFTAAECEMRKKKCKDIGSLASGASGPIKDVFACASALSIPKTSFVPFIGQAYKEGKPEMLIEKVTNDTALGYHLRRCILMQNGLLGFNDTINRMMLSAKIQSTFGWNPPLATVILEAAEVCPDQQDLKFTEFLSCIREGCMKNLPISSFAYTKTSASEDDDEDD